AIIVALGPNAGNIIAWVSFHLPLLAQIRTPVRTIYLFSFASAFLAAIGFGRVIVLAEKFNRHLMVLGSAALLCLITFEAVQFAQGYQQPRKELYPPRYYNHPALLDLERLSNDGPLLSRFIAQPFELIPPNAGDVRRVMNVHGHRATMLASISDYIWE